MDDPVKWATGIAIIIFGLVMGLPILKDLWIELRGGPKQRTYGSFSAGRPRREQIGARDHMGVRLAEPPERVSISRTKPRRSESRLQSEEPGKTTSDP